MQHQLTPKFILDRMDKGETSGRLEAACLFVDISGFTPLTVALMNHGTEGAEVLAEVLAAVFEPLIDALYRHGGFIAGFAGDAFKAVFAVDNDPAREDFDRESPDRQAVCAQALLAAWAIRTHLTESPSQATRFGAFTFSGKVFAAWGPVDWAIWRDTSKSEHSQRAASLFGGDGLAQAMAIDLHADAGQVVITKALNRNLPNGLLTTTSVADYRRVDALDAQALSVATPVHSPPTRPTDRLRAADFYPGWLLNSTLQGEFRQVVTVFVSFERSFGPVELADFQAALFRLVDQYNGFLGRVGQIGGKDNGNTLLLFWGAPTGSEHDVERALGFILDLKEISPVGLRAGVTTRMAYAGFVGSPLAEEYTCHGSYVNLAARQLVAADWGEIWIDDETARQAARRFQTDRRGLLRFKGFVDPQPVFLLTGRQTGEAQAFYAGTLVGRQAEIAELRAGIEPIFSGNFAGLVTVEGEAGLGKSRLVHEFQLQTATMAQSPRWFLCQTDDILRRPLNPLRYWLRRYFSQSADASDQINRTSFDATLDDLRHAMPDTELAAELAAELSRSRSFLAALVDLHWAGSLYARLDPQLRLENMLDALKTLIKAESLVQPVILLLEDAHWLDDESRQFIIQLTRNVDGFPLALVITQRPGDEINKLVSADMPRARIQLSGLNESQIEPIATALLGAQPSRELVNLIAIRANGNPFFAEQIVLYLQEHNMLEQGEQGLQVSESLRPENDHLEPTLLPTDVRALLTARLDQLQPKVKEVVQTASVLGREFDSRLLFHMLEKRSGEVLNRQMGEVDRARIWSAMGEARYLFRHALLRDAAYDMQLRSRLRRLHLAAAGAGRAVYAGEPSSHYAELVHHYHLGEDWEEERIHAQLAGEYAAEQYASQEALRFYTRAIDLMSDDQEAARHDVLLKREAVLDVLGDRENQQRDLDALMQIQQALPLKKQVTVQLRRAELQRNISDYAEALETVLSAQSIAQNLDDIATRIECNHLQGRILWQMGKYAEARRPLREAIELARSAGLQSYLPQCQYDIGAAYHQEGKNRAARPYFLEATHGFDQADNRMGVARCTAMIGVLDNEAGDYVSAQRSYMQSLESCESIGWRLGTAYCLGYLCNNFFALGDYSSASLYNARAHALSLELADENGIANALDTDGLIHLIQGQYAEANQLCAQALRLYQQMGDRRGEAFAMTHLGIIDLELGATASAEVYFIQANDIRSLLGDTASLVDSMAGLASIHQQRGASAPALAIVGDILDHLAQFGMEGIEFPFLVYAICRDVLIDAGNGNAPATDPMQQQAGRILDEARSELERRAMLIDEPKTRRRFIADGPFHKRLLDSSI